MENAMAMTSGTTEKHWRSCFLTEMHKCTSVQNLCSINILYLCFFFFLHYVIIFFPFCIALGVWCTLAAEKTMFYRAAKVSAARE